MSRELGPIELRVCRMVFALLGLMVVAFLVLGAIDSVFNPSPRMRKVQSQADIANARGRYPTQSIKLSTAIQKQSVEFQNDLQRGALSDGPGQVVPSSKGVPSAAMPVGGGLRANA